MLRIYKHNLFPNYYYTQYHGLITEAHADENWKFFETVTYNLPKKVIYITEYKTDAILGDNHFIKTMAKNVDKFQDRIELTAFCGMYGVRKLFFKIFISFSSSKFPRYLFDTKSELEIFLKLNLDEEFTEVYTYDPNQ